MGAIGIYGAGGHTGSLIARRLAAAGRGVLLAARRSESLAALDDVEAERLIFALDDAAAVRGFASRCAVIINCAGPFAATAPALVEAALDARVDYVDVTGEPGVAAGLLDAFQGRARSAGSAIVPAVGFFGALPDLLASAAAGDWQEVDEVTIAYALDGWRMTPASRATAQSIGGRWQTVEGGELQPARGAPEQLSFGFPAPVGTRQVLAGYPAPELATLRRSLRARRVRVLMTVSTLLDIRAPAEVHDSGPREDTSFTVVAEVLRGEAARVRSLRGRDIYGVTVPLVADVVQRLLSGVAHSGGVFAASELLQPAETLQSLPGVELSLSRTEGAAA